MAQPDAGADRELVARMAAGDERALATFYDRFATLAYSLAYQILGNSADAEEVVTDAFVQVWSQAASFDPQRASATSWLAMITRSRALDRRRARKRRAATVERASAEDEQGTAIPLGSMGADPASQAEQSDMKQRVKQTLEALPENQRKAVELAFFKGLSHSEIAAALNEPLGTVKTRIRAALDKLRNAMLAYQLVE